MLGASLTLPAYLERLNTEISRLSQPDIQQMADLIYAAWQNDKFVYIIGNGAAETHPFC